MRKPTIIAAVITACALIIAAIIGIYPSLRERKVGGVLAGIVVDENGNRGVGQAEIVIAGRDEKCVTNDEGNFRFEVGEDAPASVRLYVSKNGFQTLDTAVTPPVENLVLQLRRQ